MLIHFEQLYKLRVPYPEAYFPGGGDNCRDQKGSRGQLRQLDAECSPEHRLEYRVSICRWPLSLARDITILTIQSAVVRKCEQTVERHGLPPISAPLLVPEPVPCVDRLEHRGEE